MNPTRRQFIRQFGAMLASLVAAGCCARIRPTQCVSWSSSHRADWDKLRQCWLDLDSLNDPQGHSPELSIDEAMKNHQATLDRLVQAGEVDQAVADQMQLAFTEAAWHVEFSEGTCYSMTPPRNPQLASARFKSKTELVQQMASLVDMAQAGGLDDEAVTLAQRTIERDIAFLQAAGRLEVAELDPTGILSAIGLEDGARWAAETTLAAQLETGNVSTTPEAAEAACILVDLLLGEPE